MTGALGPKGHFTTAKVDWLGLHPRSAQLVAAWAETGRGGPGGNAVGRGMLNCYAGTQVPGWPAAPGYPVTVVPRQPWPLLDYWWSTYGGDPGGYPDWQNFPTQQGWDGYLLVAQEGGPTWEVIGVDRSFGGWIAALFGRRRGAGGAIWDKDFTPHSIPGGGLAGVCAAKYPLAPLIARADEVAAGHIDHPLHLAGGFRGVGGDPTKGEGFVWPARFHDTVWSGGDPTGMLYGTWFRLRADHPLPTERGAQVIAQALKTHGCIVGDGSAQATSGLCIDGRIGQATIDALRSIPVSAFEAVDTEPLRVKPSAKVSDPDYWLTR